MHPALQVYNQLSAQNSLQEVVQLRPLQDESHPELLRGRVRDHALSRGGVKLMGRLATPGVPTTHRHIQSRSC